MAIDKTKRKPILHFHFLGPKRETQCILGGSMIGGYNERRWKIAVGIGCVGVGVGIANANYWYVTHNLNDTESP